MSGDYVWEMRGRKVAYWITAEVYRNANDRRTYVARIETNGCYATPPCGSIYDIEFGFKTKRAAVEWVKGQRRVVRNKVNQPFTGQ